MRADDARPAYASPNKPSTTRFCVVPTDPLPSVAFITDKVGQLTLMSRVTLR